MNNVHRKIYMLKSKCARFSILNVFYFSSNHINNKILKMLLTLLHQIDILAYVGYSRDILTLVYRLFKNKRKIFFKNDF